jgi:hypothetical protein
MVTQDRERARAKQRHAQTSFQRMSSAVLAMDVEQSGLVEKALAGRGTAKARNTIQATNFALEFIVVG